MGWVSRRDSHGLVSRLVMGLLALAGLCSLLVGAPPANAYGPASASLNCAVYLNGSNSIYSNVVWSDVFALSQSPASPVAGDVVTATFTAVNGPAAPVSVPAAAFSLQVRVRVTGATRTAVTMTDGPTDTYPSAAAGPGVPLGGFTLTGSYVAAAAGDGQVSLEQVVFNEALDSPLINAPEEDVYCSGGAAGTDHKNAPAASTVIAEQFGAPSISASLWCRYYFNEATPGFAYPSSYAPYSDTFELSQSPASPTQGETVIVTMSGAYGPTYGPLAADPGIASPVAIFAVSGAATQTVALDDGPTDTYPATAVPALEAWGPFTVSGSYVASGAGSATLALQQLKFDAGRDNASSFNQYVSSNIDVYCSDSGGDRDHKTSPVVSTTIARTFTIGPSVRIESITGQASGVTGFARGGDVVTVGGEYWPPSLTGASLTAFVGSTPAASSISTDPEGAIAGTVTLPAGVATGTTVLTIRTDGPRYASIPLTVLGTPTIVLSRMGASPGTQVIVLGSNFDPSTPHYVYASKPNPFVNRSSAIPAFTGATCPAPTPSSNPLLAPAAPDNYLAGVGPFVPADANGSGPVGAASDYQPGVRDCGTALVVISGPNGTLSAAITAAESQTGVLVTETVSGSTYPDNVVGSPVNGRVAWASFTPNAASCTRQIGTEIPTLCETQQDVNATVDAGALTQATGDYDEAGSTNTSTQINLGSVTTSTMAQLLGGNLNPVTVTDTRGGLATWSLTAVMPDLTDGSTGSISRGNLALSGVTCAANAPGSATGNVAGAGGTFVGSLTLCIKNGIADSSGQTTGGRYVIDANLALTVPPFQNAAAYSSTITITLT